MVAISSFAACCAMSLTPACGDGATQAKTRRFEARLEFATASDAKPQGLLCADLDGDEHAEVIVTTIAPPSVQILSKLSRELVQPPPPRTFSIDDFSLGPVWVDRSSALAAIASRARPNIVVFDARASFAGSAAELSIAWSIELEARPRVLAAKDGREPLVAIIDVEEQLVIVRGRERVMKQPLTGSLASCARFAKDDDGLYVGFQGSRSIARLDVVDEKGARGVSGSFDLEGLPRSIDEFDVDGDGRDEIVVAGGDDRVWIFDVEFEGAGYGRKSRFRLRETLSTSEVPIDLEHGELDGAPPLELIALGLHGQDAHVLAAKGSKLAEQRIYAGQHPLDGALGDVDGDGRLDLALTNVDAKRVSVLFGTGDLRRFIRRERAGAGRSPHSIAAGDLDKDGKLDVVALSALESKVSTLLYRDGALAPGVSQGSANAADAVRCADIDGDGNVDVLCLQRDDSGTKLVPFFGDGTGRLVSRALVPAVHVGASAGDMLVHDLDGDGTLEAVASDPEGSRVALVTIERGGEGGVRLSSARTLDVPAGPKGLAALQSSDGDALEIAVALGGPGARLGVAFLRVVRDPSGAIALEEYAHVALPDPVLAVAAADFDRDALDDLAILCQRRESEAFVRIGVQTRQRTWTSVASLATGLRPYAIRTGDLDGDGRADLVVSTQNSHHVECWLARAGEPVSFARMPDLGAGTGCLDVLLVDLDGDGALEIVVANAFSDDVTTIRVR